MKSSKHWKGKKMTKNEKVLLFLLVLSGLSWGAAGYFFMYAINAHP